MNWNEMVIAQFNEGREKVADMFDRDSLVLLETVGAKSGETRISPLMSFQDGDRVLIVASAAGADKHPAWFHNLTANPQVRFRRWEGGQIAEHDAVAAALPEDERAAAYDRIVAVAPGFGEYREKTDRVIPVVALTPTN